MTCSAAAAAAASSLGILETGFRTKGAIMPWLSWYTRLERRRRGEEKKEGRERRRGGKGEDE